MCSLIEQNTTCFYSYAKWNSIRMQKDIMLIKRFAINGKLDSTPRKVCLYLCNMQRNTPKKFRPQDLAPISERHNSKVALLVYLIFSRCISLAWPGKLFWLRNAHTTNRGWIISITFRVLEDQIWHYLVPPTTKMVWLIVGFFTCVNKRFS